MHNQKSNGGGGESTQDGSEMSLQFRASVRGTMSHRIGVFMVDSLSYFSFQQVPMAVCV